MNDPVELRVVTDPVNRVRCGCGRHTFIVSAETYHGGPVEWTADCGTHFAYIPDDAA